MSWFSEQGYWLGRLVFERAMAAIYLIAFVVAANQSRALLGADGLLPIPRFLARTTFRRYPSIFHFYYADWFLVALSWLGAAVSAAIVAGVADMAPVWGYVLLWIAPWVIYLSIVNVGQTWYGFGWESLLVEAGFLAIFLGPGYVSPPVTTMWLARWLLFRLEFGAGMIKMRGDPCWRDLTCLYYHHETQPMPGPLSWFFHHLPKPLHRVEVLANHVAQLLVPFALFTPQPAAGIAALIIVVTQCWLVASGNFSWLNALTIVLGLSALSAGMLHAVIPLSRPAMHDAPPWYQGIVLAFTALIAVLSYWPVRNLLSRRQLMNFSFNQLHLCNTYGAFGSIGRTRNEIVIEGTDTADLTGTTAWKEYEFKGKPGDPRRVPPQIAPYHLRLDWLMWFAAISPAYAESWFAPFVIKLLQGDRRTLRLLRSNPFPDGPPTHIRARLYRYRYTSFREWRRTGAWWDRRLIDDFFGPVSLRSGRVR